MATDNEMRTLIALGAFSSVQGGGDIPEDLEVKSLTADCVKSVSLHVTGPATVYKITASEGCVCNVHACVISARWTHSQTGTIGGLTISGGSAFMDGPLLIGGSAAELYLKNQPIKDFVKNPAAPITLTNAGSMTIKNGRRYLIDGTSFTMATWLEVQDYGRAEIQVQNKSGGISFPSSWWWADGDEYKQSASSPIFSIIYVYLLSVHNDGNRTLAKVEYKYQNGSGPTELPPSKG